MINTLNDFIREYKKIVDMGWIRTHRAGPTGIGKTLEDLLGIVENNIDGPDFGEYELKSCRINSNSMLTMFTLSPLPRGANTTLRIKYGYSSEFYDNYEKVLHATLSGDRFTHIADTGHSLKFTCKTDGIYIESENGVENIYWSRENLKNQFEKKYKNKFVYAKADSRGNGVDEEFLFKEAWEVSGFNYDSFIKMLEDGKIYVDLRIGQYHGGSKDGKTHDHGTAFRIREYDQQFLFTINKKIV
jgi:R.mvaI